MLHYDAELELTLSMMGVITHAGTSRFDSGQAIAQ